jgi:hypothetical protein
MGEVQPVGATKQSSSGAIFRFIALAGFPLSLGSPGATISAGLVALYGVYLMLRGNGLPADLRRAGLAMLACYVLLVGVDLLNGGGPNNIETAFNYLPLLALAPYALAARSVELDRDNFEIAIGATLLLALCISVVRFAVLGEERPGGINLVSIGYGLVVSVWVVFMLSIALEGGTNSRVKLAIAAIGVVPVLITESKIDVAALVVGCLAVALLWAHQHGRWRVLVISVGGLAIPFAATLWLAMSQRLTELWSELSAFFLEGSTAGPSFGLRYELNVAALRAFLERPVLGHGFAERMSRVNENATPGGPDISFIAYVHNDYVTHMLAYGLFGLVFLFGYLTLVFTLVRRVPDEAFRRAAIALLPMIAVYMMADVAFNMDPVSGLLTIVLGTTLALAGARAQEVSPARP